MLCNRTAIEQEAVVLPFPSFTPHQSCSCVAHGWHLRPSPVAFKRLRLAQLLEDKTSANVSTDLIGRRSYRQAAPLDRLSKARRRWRCWTEQARLPVSQFWWLLVRSWRLSSSSWKREPSAYREVILEVNCALASPASDHAMSVFGFNHTTHVDEGKRKCSCLMFACAGDEECSVVDGDV